MSRLVPIPQHVCVSQSMPHTSAFRIDVLCAVCAGQRNSKASQNFSVQCGKNLCHSLEECRPGDWGLDCTKHGQFIAERMVLSNFKRHVRERSL